MLVTFPIQLRYELTLENPCAKPHSQPTNRENGFKNRRKYEHHMSSIKAFAQTIMITLNIQRNLLMEMKFATPINVLSDFVMSGPPLSPTQIDW